MRARHFNEVEIRVASNAVCVCGTQMLHIVYNLLLTCARHSAASTAATTCGT